MARPGDIAFSNGIWLQYATDTDLQRLTQPIQDYLNQRYEGVSGTGVNQVFIPFAEDDLAPVNKANVLERLQVDVLKTKPSPTGPSSATPQKNTRERF